jgi:hypothetical protein
VIRGAKRPCRDASRTTAPAKVPLLFRRGRPERAWSIAEAFVERLAPSRPVDALKSLVHMREPGDPIRVSAPASPGLRVSRTWPTAPWRREAPADDCTCKAACKTPRPNVSAVFAAAGIGPRLPAPIWISWPAGRALVRIGQMPRPRNIAEGATAPSNRLVRPQDATGVLSKPSKLLSWRGAMTSDGL